MGASEPKAVMADRNSRRSMEHLSVQSPNCGRVAPLDAHACGSAVRSGLGATTCSAATSAGVNSARTVKIVYWRAQVAPTKVQPASRCGRRRSRGERNARQILPAVPGCRGPGRLPAGGFTGLGAEPATAGRCGRYGNSCVQPGAQEPSSGSSVECSIQDVRGAFVKCGSNNPFRDQEDNWRSLRRVSRVIVKHSR